MKELSPIDNWNYEYKKHILEELQSLQEELEVVKADKLLKKGKIMPVNKFKESFDSIKDFMSDKGMLFANRNFNELMREYSKYVKACEDLEVIFEEVGI